MTDQHDQHRCRRGGSCPNREVLDDGTVVGALVAQPGLCRSDERLLGRALDELPALWVGLRQLIRPSMEVGAGGPSGSREAPLPLRADPLVTAEQIRDELVLWATLVRSATGMRAAPRPVVTDTVHPADRAAYLTAAEVGASASLLSRTREVLLGLESRELQRWDPAGAQLAVVTQDGVDGAVALLELHWRATGAAGRRRLVHYLPTPCPRCDAPTLQREDGDDEVQCVTCGTAWGEERYAFFTRVLAEDFTWAARCPRCDELGRRLDDLEGPLCDHAPADDGDDEPAAPETAEASGR